MLMVSHAGRYGVAGFNVAHFGWLDALQPTPSATSYVAVLLMCGLLALVLAWTGPKRAAVVVLFVLYTFSWAMSMLDSYQHHYFVSIVLLCLAFFPETSAAQIHPLPDPSKRKHDQERSARYERNGFVYAGAVVALCAGYAIIDSGGHTWTAFLVYAGALAIATYLYEPAPRGGGPLLTAGFGYSLLGASVAIVYTYTAIAKTDANWLDGHTLLRISSAGEFFGGMADYAERLGLPRDRFFALLSTAIVPQELTVALCYLVSVVQDRARSRWPRIVGAIGFALSVVLHVGAEAMGLEIGWFSYYMLLFACCFLLPLAVVDRLAVLFTWPARWLGERAREWELESPMRPAPGLLIASGCLALLVMVGQLLDLPGAIEACGLAGMAVLALTVRTLTRPAEARRDPRLFAVATMIAAACLWAAVASTDVRFDYYRYLGGDQYRRGELEAALATYQRGERYAKFGQSRKAKIEEIRRKLDR